MNIWKCVWVRVCVCVRERERYHTWSFPNACRETNISKRNQINKLLIKQNTFKICSQACIHLHTERALTSAPASMSFLTHSMRPRWAAEWRGVLEIGTQHYLLFVHESSLLSLTFLFYLGFWRIWNYLLERIRKWLCRITHELDTLSSPSTISRTPFTKKWL